MGILYNCPTCKIIQGLKKCKYCGKDTIECGTYRFRYPDEKSENSTEK